MAGQRDYDVNDPSTWGWGGDNSGLLMPATYSSQSPSTPTSSLLSGATTAAAGAADPSKGWLGISGLGANVGSLQGLLGGVNSIGQLFNAYQAQKLAKESLDFQKQTTATNMTNQLKSYNTQLTDRVNSRAAVNGMTDADKQAYLNANRLSQ
jgi:hypothetical protein